VQGQPDVALPSQDSCYISCTLQDADYSRIRNRTFSGTGPVTETWVYTRNWRIEWAAYGPNSFDRARQIHSALFIDFFNDQFQLLGNLFPVLDPPEPVRLPENHNAQWYDATRFYCNFYEQVTETIQDNVVVSVEFKVFDKDGEAADITVPTS
jgi:hypothetical protein